MGDGPKPKICFVVGPIGEPGSEQRRHADMLLNAVLREVLNEGTGWKLWRADEVADPGMINDHVTNDVLTSDLVVADRGSTSRGTYPA